MAGWRIAFGCVALSAIVAGTIGALASLETPAPLETTLRLVLLTGGDDSYWQALAHGAETAAAKCGVELMIDRLNQNGENCESKQASEARAAPGVSGVVYCHDARSPIDSSAIVGFADQPMLITCGADSWPADRLCHVGIANYSAGRICAMLARQACSTPGRILVLVDGAAQSEAAKRLSGFEDALSFAEIGEPGAETSSKALFVTCVVDNRDASAANKAIRRALAENPTDEIVVDFCDFGVSTILQAITSGAGEKTPRLVTFDQSEAALAAIESGQVLAVMGHDPYEQGYRAIDRMAMICRSGPLGWPVSGKGFVSVVPTVVRQGNVAEFRARLKAGAPGA